MNRIGVAHETRRIVHFFVAYMDDDSGCQEIGAGAMYYKEIRRQDKCEIRRYWRIYVSNIDLRGLIRKVPKTIRSKNGCQERDAIELPADLRYKSYIVRVG